MNKYISSHRVYISIRDTLTSQNTPVTPTEEFRYRVDRSSNEARHRSWPCKGLHSPRGIDETWAAFSWHSTRQNTDAKTYTNHHRKLHARETPHRPQLLKGVPLPPSHPAREDELLRLRVQVDCSLFGLHSHLHALDHLPQVNVAPGDADWSSIRGGAHKPLCTAKPPPPSFAGGKHAPVAGPRCV